jgi:hypothetical protein
MIKNDQSCDNIKLKIMALLDDELSQEDILEVETHLKSCVRCSKEYSSLKKLKEVTNSMNLKNLPEFYWDDYWTHVYNRIERGISWLLISLGAIIVLAFVGWEAITSLVANQEMSPLLKVGIFILMLGSVILIISILREKLLVKRIDKYREVER